MGSSCRTTNYSQAKSVIVVLPRGCVAMNMGTSLGNDCLKAACSLHHPIPCCPAWCTQDRHCQGVGEDLEWAVSCPVVIHLNSCVEYEATWLPQLAMKTWQDSCATLGRDRFLGTHNGSAVLREPPVQMQEDAVLPVGLAAIPVPWDSTPLRSGRGMLTASFGDGHALSRVSHCLCPRLCWQWGQ